MLGGQRLIEDGIAFEFRDGTEIGSDQTPGSGPKEPNHGFSNSEELRRLLNKCELSRTRQFIIFRALSTLSLWQK